MSKTLVGLLLATVFIGAAALGYLTGYGRGEAAGLARGRAEGFADGLLRGMAVSPGTRQVPIDTGTVNVVNENGSWWVVAQGPTFKYKFTNETAARKACGFSDVDDTNWDAHAKGSGLAHSFQFKRPLTSGSAAYLRGLSAATPGAAGTTTLTVISAGGKQSALVFVNEADRNTVATQLIGMLTSGLGSRIDIRVDDSAKQATVFFFLGDDEPDVVTNSSTGNCAQ